MECLYFPIDVLICAFQLNREEGTNQLARKAFDYARSIDPSLSLPWAGMSADFPAR